MVLYEWKYTADQASPFIELNCTEEELAEAEALDPSQFMVWLAEVASGASHVEAMEWIRENE